MTHLLLLAALLGPTVNPDSIVSSPAPEAADARLATFGASLAMSGDYAFVGEPRGPSGIVHVYERSGNSWRATSMVKAPNAAPNDGFGATVAADGNLLLVSQQTAPTSPDGGRGMVHAFTRGADGSWTAAGIWTAEEPMPRAAFGASMVIDGDMALIGAPRHENGAVFMFRRSAAGAWAPAGRLMVEGLAEGDLFGASLAADGERVVVGAPGRAEGKGAVYVFTRDGAGQFAQSGLVVAAAGTEGAQLGSSVALKGNMLVAGAPSAYPIPGRRASSMGSATVFEYSDVGEIWKERRSFVPFQSGSARFGQAVAMAGDEIWISAPLTQFNAGAVYRMKPTADGSWTEMRTLIVPDVEAGASFGATMAVSGNRAAIGMPTDAGGAGTVMFLAGNGSGTWTSSGTVFPAPTTKTYSAVEGKEVMCGSDGKANEFECGNASLYSFLPISAIGGKRGTSLNDNWGWTDPVTNKEIAILGRTDGTSFVDISDPANPKYLGDLPKTKGTPSAPWRDMKVVKDHAFIVADNAGEHGMQVFDLTRLRNVTSPETFTPDLTYDRINSAHNIVSNEATGFVYIVGASGGGETCGGGHHVVDVNDPKKPKFSGCFGDDKTGRAGTGYSHDSQCVLYHGPDEKYAGREICIGSNETALSIADVTDKKNPVYISRASYPNVAYAHQAWLTEDHKYLYLNDEGDESSGQGEAAKGTRTLVWDVQDLDDPVLVQEHVGTTKAIDHNLYVKGDRMYQSNYTSGLRILDISDPRNPKEVGFLDTHPGDDGTPSFSGSWSVYPFFKSGAIVVTSIGEGVFFVRDRTRPVVQ